MNATASKLNFKSKLERYFQRKYITHLILTLHTRGPNTQWAGYSTMPALHSVLGLHWICPLPTSPCLHLHAFTHTLMWVCNSYEDRAQQNEQGPEFNPSTVKARQQTQQLNDAHTAFPKSQLMSSPSLVPPYFTLSLYIIPALPVTATICNRITTRSTVFTYLGISTAWLFPAQRPSNDLVWIWMNSNSILKLLSFQLRWETLHFLAATDLSPEATSWILSCSLSVQRISRYILNRSLPCDWHLPWQWRWMMTRCTLVGCCHYDKASQALWLTSSRKVFFRVLEADVESESYKVGSN